MDEYDACPDLPLTPFSTIVGGLVAPEQLIGRSHEIELVQQAIESASGAVLVGDRRMGKTSLLRKLEALYDAAGHQVVRVSAETESPATFAATLESALHRRSWFAKERERWRLDISVGKWGVVLRREGGAGETVEETDFFAWAAERVAPGRLIVIIDELTVLLLAMAPSPADAAEFMHSLRRSAQQHSNLTFILAGSIGLHHVVPEGQGLINDKQSVAVAALDACDALHLARCLVAGNEVNTDDERTLARTIAAVAGNIPFYIQFLVQQITPALLAEPADVDALLEAALTDPLDPLDMRHYRDRLPKYYGSDAELAERCLDHYALEGPLSIEALHQRLSIDDGDVPPSRREVVRMVERLERDHYLQRLADQRDQFASVVLRRGWLAIQRLA